MYWGWISSLCLYTGSSSRSKLLCLGLGPQDAFHLSPCLRTLPHIFPFPLHPLGYPLLPSSSGDSVSRLLRRILQLPWRRQVRTWGTEHHVMFLQKRLFPCKTILWEITWGSLKAGIFLAGAILRSLAFTFCHGDKNVPHLGEWMQKTRRWGIPSVPHPGRRPSTLVERSQCSLWCISLDKAEMLSYGPKNVLEFAARWFRVLPCSEEKNCQKSLFVLIFIWVIFTLTYPDIHL